MQQITLVSEILQTLGILGAFYFTGRQLKTINDRSVYDVYGKFSDRMMVLRQLMIADEDIRKIWEGGRESEALSEMADEKHFYFAKMLFQINEAFFLALEDPSINTSAKGFHKAAWRANFKTDLTASTFRKVWSRYAIVQESYDEKFRAEVNQIIREIETQGYAPAVIGGQSASEP
ncbi:hypothetical protein JQC91_14650 [Jannaschia sp. Os4]|uniref:hypothetical protein n=1 Tax=Jannaschia sp. Os4 TaxID=2807617 RepID=UPI0019392AE4|nr:hypothetical protein [Jannaschia sp. Os4]MBM2577545.1 hypothetical protein [Jannaschia sp. Os4]